MSNIIEEIKQAIGKDKVRENEPLKLHTSFRIGGPARIFLTPDTIEDIQKSIKICQEHNMPYFILGNGSNLLVSDKGYDGVIIQLFDHFNDIEVENDVVRVQAGALMSRLSNVLAREGLSGFEAASGIPGTIGGAVVMNAGAYGFEMKDIVIDVTVMDSDGSLKVIPGEQMDFGYRHSICSEKDYVVIAARLKLQAGNEADIRERMRELKEQRVSKQPLEYPSAGSTFKRPEGYFAGKLIMDAGLKGYTVGGAQVSEKHAGFVINIGNASAKDVMDLISHVQEVILDKDGVKLEMEVKTLGEF